MDRPFTYELGCCSCSKRFKTLVAVRKHVEKKHTGENLSLQSVRFWDKEQCAIPVPVIKLLDRRSTDYKQGYLPWLAGMTEQINASLHPCLRGKYHLFNQLNKKQPEVNVGLLSSPRGGGGSNPLLNS